MNTTDSKDALEPKRIWINPVVFLTEAHREKGRISLERQFANDIEYVRASVAAVEGDAELYQVASRVLRWLYATMNPKAPIDKSLLKVTQFEIHAELERAILNAHAAQVRSRIAAAASSPAEPAQPLCPVHRHLEDTDRLECEIGNDCIACSLNERRELLQLIAPFAAGGNTEDSVTVMRRVAEFYATHVGEGRVIVSYTAPLQPESEQECQRCGKTGGKVVSFSCGSLTTARWVCPYCLDAAAPPAAPVVARESVREIVKKIADAAIELAFVRHELTTTDYEEEEHADVEEGVEAFKALVEEVKADVLACLTGDETGCLDPEDVDYDNELEWTVRHIAKHFTATPSPETPVGGERYALSSQCDNRMHRECPYPDKCKCRCHGCAGADNEIEGYCWVCRSTHVLTAGNCRAMDSIA